METQIQKNLLYQKKEKNITFVITNQVPNQRHYEYIESKYGMFTSEESW